MILYTCRHCHVRVWFVRRPAFCSYCQSPAGFDEVWTAHDHRLGLALEQWNVAEVLTGKFRLSS